MSKFIQIFEPTYFRSKQTHLTLSDPSFVYKCCGSPQGKGIPDAIATSVLGNINLSRVFRELDDHMVDSAVNENHTFRLIKIICKCYCKIRLYHLGKEFTAKMAGTKIRKKLSKLVLFKHQ